MGLWSAGRVESDVVPGKQARVLCPVCAEPMPPDETECWNCGAFVIDEAVVRLSRAFGLDREKALKLFEAGFRHTKQLKDRDPNRVLETGEVGLLFICTNCGSFVASGDTNCPRCASEFELEPADATPEEDILDIVLCPVCGADNDPELPECEVCGEALKETEEPEPLAPKGVPTVPPVAEAARIETALDKVDDFLKESDVPVSATPQPTADRPSASRPESLRPVPTPKPAVPVPNAPALPRSKSTPNPARVEPDLVKARASSPRPTPMRSRPPSPGRPIPAVRETPNRVAPKGPTTISLREATAVPSAPKSRVRTRSSSTPEKRAPGAIQARTGISAETAGSLVLAAGASLLLAGALGQRLVSAGIAAFLVGVIAYITAGYVRSRGPQPGGLEGVLLGAGVLLGLAVLPPRGIASGTTAAVAVAAAAAVPFAAATRRLLEGPQRILLAITAGIPVVGQALATATDPTYAMTLPWSIGILAAMPWPAALAAEEVFRRQSASILRKQVVRAERDMRSKDYQRSLAEYDRAIATARGGVLGAEIPWYGKGATLILLGRYDEALRAIDTALDINPRNEVAWVNKGNALTKMGRLIDALRCFNAAIKVSSTYEVAWNNKGNALARLGKFEEAVSCYERALEIDASYRGAWVNMGFVLTKLGRFDEAASCADRALLLDSTRRADPI